MQCESCGQEARTAGGFCTWCGHRQALAGATHADANDGAFLPCSACGATNFVPFYFCAGCGTPHDPERTASAALLASEAPRVSGTRPSPAVVSGTLTPGRTATGAFRSQQLAADELAAERFIPTRGVRAALESSGEHDVPASEPGEASDPFIGRSLFGRYLLVKKLGAGGMGAVYRARHEEIGQDLAVKFLHGRLSRNQNVVRRFYREARLACRLDHPNIVQTHVFGQLEDGTLYLAMEYLRGESLRRILQAEGRLAPVRAVRMILATLRGLAEAHRRGVVHRDLKPENILVTPRHVALTEDGTTRDIEDAKLLDFGIAKIVEPESPDEAEQLTQAGTVHGTPRYMAPEQLTGKDVDDRSDVYALGIILYECLSGTLPFTAPSLIDLVVQITRDPPRPLREAAPHVPKALAAVVERAIARDPAARYPSAASFYRALCTALPAAVDRTGRRWRTAALVAAGWALAATLAALGFALS